MTEERDELFAARALVMVAAKAIALSYAPMFKMRETEIDALRKVADSIREAEQALVDRLVETRNDQ